MEFLDRIEREIEGSTMCRAVEDVSVQQKQPKHGY